MQTTYEGSTAHERIRAHRGLRLTVLWHHDASRIGEHTTVPLGGSQGLDLSRLSPVFDSGRALEHPRLSRTPLHLTCDGEDGVRLTPGRVGLVFTINGQSGPAGTRITSQELESGVVLGLGRGVLLLVERARNTPQPARHGLVGVSQELEALRCGIDVAAADDSPVLITGPSGTGKELVAAAIHAASKRHSAPFIALNLSALPAGMAVSQLFGHSRGAFTGAERAAKGYFGQAEGGTLLLDELGASDTTVQALLLRALESGEIQPVGQGTRKVNVRIIAATDEDLEQAAEEKRFLRPVYYRLAHHVLKLPPLSARPADIAVQAVHFLREALKRRTTEDLLSRGWLGLETMEALLAWSWPGNTRELLAATGRMASLGAYERRCPPPQFSALSSGQADAPQPQNRSLLSLLSKHAFELKPTARALGIGINTLRRRMAAEGLPRPKDLNANAIHAALTAGGGFRQAAKSLQVSERGLRLRANALGLTFEPRE